jgi:thiol-disulfide isomerase/thioredoxin
LSDAKGNVVLLNFWATWCVPCIEEFPDLLRIRSECASKGLDLVLVSIDDLKKTNTDVRRFLRKMDVSFPTYIKSARDDEAFINSVDPAWRGAIPATFIFDRQGKLVHSLIDAQTFEGLTGLLTPLLVE